jgi:hypothetical protein
MRLCGAACVRIDARREAEILNLYAVMEKGECIYLLSPDGDRIGLSLLVPPSIEEGISVRGA